MLTEIINLRSLVASKARLNAALRRQHSRVANNQSEALPSQSPALPFSHGFPNSLETVFLTQTDYFLIAVTGEQSRSLPTRRLIVTDRRLPVWITSGFVLADYSGVDAIFVTTRAFTVLIQSRLHRCW